MAIDPGVLDSKSSMCIGLKCWRTAERLGDAASGADDAMFGFNLAKLFL